MYSGGETSGLESSFTSPSVHHKDFIEQYLNKLSYLPGDVITNSEPLLTALHQAGTSQHPFTTSYSSSMFMAPNATSTTAGLHGLGGAAVTSGIGAGPSYTDLIAATSAAAEKEHILYNSLSSDTLLLDGLTGGGGSNVVDMLEIPGKGRCFVYFARYSYDPFAQSLNDNPESELPLTAGDYVLVWGDADEDGYLEGELLDGRKGLVPMNFCEKLTGEDLLEFHQQVVLGFTSEEEVWSTMVPNDLPMDVTVPNATGTGTGALGIDSSGLMATPIDDHVSYTNPCKIHTFLFKSSCL